MSFAIVFTASSTVWWPQNL